MKATAHIARHGCINTSSPEPRPASKTPLAWLLVGASALALAVAFRGPMQAWLAGFQLPETLVVMLSMAVALATWAAARGLAEDGEPFPAPEPDGALRQPLSLRDRLVRGVVDAAEQRQFALKHRVEVGVIRQLDGAAVLARLLEKKLEDQSRPEAGDVAKLRELVERTIFEAQLLAEAAHPATIETDGLESSLRKLAAEAEKYDTHCHVVGGADRPQNESAVALQLYRVVQIVVERAIRHGKPHHILVELASSAEKYLSMTVTDSVGRGDRLPELSNAEVCELQARARSIGGVLQVEYPEGAVRLSCRMISKGPQSQF